MAYPMRDRSYERRAALLCLIHFRGGQMQSDATYAPLAEFFNLTNGERTRVIEDGTNRSYWDNLVQNSRQHLVRDGYLRRGPQAIWRLTPKGEAYAKTLAPAYERLRPRP